jgi:hypothetical protein
MSKEASAPVQFFLFRLGFYGKTFLNSDNLLDPRCGRTWSRVQPTTVRPPACGFVVDAPQRRFPQQEGAGALEMNVFSKSLPQLQVHKPSFSFLGWC